MQALLSGLITAAYHPGTWQQTRWHGTAWTDWFMHHLMSALIHSFIYATVFRLMRRLSLGEALVLCAVVIGAIFLWARSRDRR